MLVGFPANQSEGFGQWAQACLGQQQDRQDRFECSVGIGVIDSARWRERMFLLGCQTGQRLQIVTEYACSEILHDHSLR